MTALGLEELAALPTSAMPEANLVHGYSGASTQVEIVRLTEVARNQVEPCSCGGAVEVVWPATPAEAIVQHNQVPEHIIWRRRHGIA